MLILRNLMAKLRLAVAVILATFALASPTLGASNDHFDLARRWAPKFYCDIHAENLRADVPTDIHFDRDVDAYPTGDGVITDNWDNLDLVAPYARVYYAVIETETHFYISYFLYHPRDWESLDKKRVGADKDWPFGIEHEHDLEGVTLVVTNPGDDFVVAYTQAHGDTYYFSDGSPAIPNCDEPLEGFPYSSWDHRDSGFGNGQAMPEDATMHFDGSRPLIFVEREGHGIGQIQRALEPNGSGSYTVSGATYRFYDNDGIVLVPAADGVSAGVPTTANMEYAYGLMSFADEFWAKKTNGAWFSESYPTLSTMRGVVFTGLGGTFAVGAGHNEGASPPWTWQELKDCPWGYECLDLDEMCAGGDSRGDWFLDPAQFVYSHIGDLAGISRNYVDNEFLMGENRIVVDAPEAWTLGDLASASWTVSEAPAGSSRISAECVLELIDEAGTLAWTSGILATDDEQDSFYVPPVTPGIYRLRVRSHSDVPDGAFLPISGISGPFAISAQSGGYVDLQANRSLLANNGSDRVKFEAQLRSASGGPYMVPGVPVDFTIVSGSASLVLDSAAGLTDASGIATVWGTSTTAAGTAEIVASCAEFTADSLMVQVQAATYLCANITTNTTLTAANSPYVVTCPIIVYNDATLTINPGVVLKFAAGAALVIANYNAGSGGVNAGIMRAIGTSSSPITFTSLSGDPGGWKGIYFGARSDYFSGTAMDYCVVENAGEINYDGVAANVTCHNTNLPTMTNCTLRNSSGYGIHFYASSPQLSNVAFEGNGAQDVNCIDSSPGLTGCSFAAGSHLGVVVTSTTSAPSLVGCAFSGQGSYALRVGPNSRMENITLSGYTLGIEVLGGGMTASRTWSALSPGLAYVIDGDVIVYNDATLTLNPGTVLKFADGASLVIANYNAGSTGANAGLLKALGTSNSRVTFTSLSGESGGWKGLYFGARSDYFSGTVMNYCVVENAGAINYDGVAANITCHSTNLPTMTNCTLRNSSGYGIHFYASSPQLSNVVFEGNGAQDVNCIDSSPGLTGCSFAAGSHLGVVVTSTTSAPSLVGCAFSGQGSYALRVGPNSRMENITLSGYTLGIEVLGGGMTASRTWSALSPGLAYVIDGDVIVYNDATLTLNPGTVLKFADGASLVIANYNAGSSGANAGLLKALGTSESRVTFTSLSGESGGWKGLYFGDRSDYFSGTVMNYCVVENAGAINYDGVAANITCHSTNLPRITNCVIRAANGYGIYLYNSQPVISQSNFLYNNVAIFNASAVTVQAINNWWGDSTGPHDGSPGAPDYNPGGIGQSVSDYVAYRPWLGSAVAPVSDTVPLSLYLAQNSPNPFNAATILEFGLETSATVSISIYDTAGRLVRVLSAGECPAGKNHAFWDGKGAHGDDMPSGVYFYRLNAGSFTQTRKMVLLR